LTDNEFFVSEEYMDLVFGGKKFRIKGISIDEFLRIMREYLKAGLVEAPFKISKENIDRLKSSLVFPLATAIMNLSNKKFRDFALKKTENPIAA